MEHGKLYHADKETLITTGATQSDLMLILNGNATVVREGDNIVSLKRRQFIAEISYLTGKLASETARSKQKHVPGLNFCEFFNPDGSTEFPPASD